MIDVIILTSSPLGFASVQLNELVKSNKIRVKGVVLSEGQIHNKKKYYIRKIKKTLKIGVFGAINGIKMRKWYSQGVSQYLDVQLIDTLCKKHNIPLFKTPTINCTQTAEYFKEVGADLGLSLGNGYIGKKIFSIPKHGMVNIHHEELPAFQNAQSIIWQIHNNSINTGYTIHQIDKHIDTGAILMKEAVPILMKEDLEQTVSYNYAVLWQKSSEGLVKLLENFDSYFQNRIPQGEGNNYTTPNLFQYLKMRKNFKKMKKEYDLKGGQTS